MSKVLRGSSASLLALLAAGCIKSEDRAPFDPRELRARVQALLRLVQRESDRNPTSGLPGGRAIDREIMNRIIVMRRTGHVA